MSFTSDRLSKNKNGFKFLFFAYEARHREIIRRTYHARYLCDAMTRRIEWPCLAVGRKGFSQRLNWAGFEIRCHDINSHQTETVLLKSRFFCFSSIPHKTHVITIVFRILNGLKLKKEKISICLGDVGWLSGDCRCLRCGTSLVGLHL